MLRAQPLPTKILNCTAGAPMRNPSGKISTQAPNVLLICNARITIALSIGVKESLKMLSVIVMKNVTSVCSANTNITQLAPPLEDVLSSIMKAKPVLTGPTHINAKMGISVPLLLQVKLKLVRNSILSRQEQTQ